MADALNVRMSFLPPAFKTSMVIGTLRHVCPVPIEMNPRKAPTIEFMGPFTQGKRKRTPIERLLKRVLPPPPGYGAKVRVYVTGENTRPDMPKFDYAISHDLGVSDARHFRLPGWWSCIDWSHKGIHSIKPARIGKLIELETLQRPLGEAVLSRPRRMAIFTTHLREPRLSLFKELSKAIEIDGYGKAFDPAIRNHNESGLVKDEILADYMYSLCPENGMHPGYYTEKIPESFAAGCIPVTWTDSNVDADFNPGAMINMAEFLRSGYREGFIEATRPERLEQIVATPLLSHLPPIDAFVDFMRGIVEDALT